MVAHTIYAEFTESNGFDVGRRRKLSLIEIHACSNMELSTALGNQLFKYHTIAIGISSGLLLQLKMPCRSGTLYACESTARMVTRQLTREVRCPLQKVHILAGLGP